MQNDLVRLAAPDVQDFIRTHETTDERDLVLRQKQILGIPSALIANQIAARRKAKEKIPGYYAMPGIIYPPSLNLEQSSSEITAQFKALTATQNLPSKSLMIDMTGGFGIDTLHFSRVFQNVMYNEKDPALASVAAWNFQKFQASNISTTVGNAVDFLEHVPSNADLIYIDPSRRTASGKKFMLADCEPDILHLQDLLLSKSAHLMVKASPLLDLRAAIGQLKHVSDVFVVAVENECKELLFLCRRGAIGEPLIHAVNLPDKSFSSFVFRLSEEDGASTTYGEPDSFLFEPNAAILKSGAFKLLASRYNLRKLAPNTHLYTNDQPLNDFPGRVFRIEEWLKSDSKTAAQVLPGRKANFLLRNYPLTVAQLSAKVKIDEGGEKFIIGASFGTKKQLFVASRIK